MFLVSLERKKRENKGIEGSKNTSFHSLRRFFFSSSSYGKENTNNFLSLISDERCCVVLSPCFSLRRVKTHRTDPRKVCCSLPVVFSSWETTQALLLLFLDFRCDLSSLNPVWKKRPSVEVDTEDMRCLSSVLTSSLLNPRDVWPFVLVHREKIQNLVKSSTLMMILFEVSSGSQCLCFSAIFSKSLHCNDNHDDDSALYFEWKSMWGRCSHAEETSFPKGSFIL
jgi:hypothetical protein